MVHDLSGLHKTSTHTHAGARRLCPHAPCTPTDPCHTCSTALSRFQCLRHCKTSVSSKFVVFHYSMFIKCALSLLRPSLFRTISHRSNHWITHHGICHT